jgi:hypothetical protein
VKFWIKPPSLRVFEVYLAAPESEKQEAKAEYIAKLRDFSSRVLR